MLHREMLHRDMLHRDMLLGYIPVSTGRTLNYFHSAELLRYEITLVAPVAGRVMSTRHPG